MNFRHSQQVNTEQYGGQTESLRRRNYARKGLEHGRAEACSGVALCSLLATSAEPHGVISGRKTATV